MITPRRTRLLKVPNLRAAQDAIAQCACDQDVRRTRSCAVLLPSRAAAAELLVSLEGRHPAHTTLVLPDLLTRDEWYERLHDHALPAHPRLTTFDREVMLAASARQAIAGGSAPPFKLRPGLIAALLDFYDALRRQLRTVDAFERLAVDELSRDAETDRGAARLQQQARFMAETFKAYERRIGDGGGIDEHTLRARLLEPDRSCRYRRVVIAIGDRAADPDGLWPADFDLLTRLPGLDEIDLVATTRVLAVGFQERLHEWLPGLEEVDWPGRDSTRLVLMTPAEEKDSLWFCSRDREEELIDIARWTKVGANPPLHRLAVVFKRPLPYVYLGRQVFGAAGIPFQTADALPLAAEPFAAALDLLFEAAAGGFTRPAVIALLRSPHFVFGPEGAPVSAGAVAALDRALSEAGYVGELSHLQALTATWAGQGLDELGAAEIALRVMGEIDPLTRPASASRHLQLVLDLLGRYERLPSIGDPVRERHLRARAAVLAALSSLRDAHVRHDDPETTIDELAAAIRRWIEDQTFSPRAGEDGLHLADAPAARFGDFDDVCLVGLVDRDWPGGLRRNIFFPAGLLNQLGWPRESDRLAAARAAFDDLLFLPHQRLRLSTFSLEDDGVVEASPFLDEIRRADFDVMPVQEATAVRILPDEALSQLPPALDGLGPETAAWAALRLHAHDDHARFQGHTGPHSQSSYSISSLERYLDCPFKYFATHVLRLREDPDDDALSAPKARGRFVHDVFRRFFEAWHASGQRAITPETIGAARRLFREIVDQAVRSLPEAEAALERMRLVGSLVSPGFGEIVLRAELEDPRSVVERFLEIPLESQVEVPSGDGARTVTLRGVADRIDLLADGTFRLVDYKLGRAPDLKQAIQLPMYALFARAHLTAITGTSWQPSSAMYLALGGKQHVAPLTAKDEWDEALESGRTRCIEALAGIERGEFPPRPQEPFYCGFCPYSGVCRKDYVDVE